MNSSWKLKWWTLIPLHNEKGIVLPVGLILLLLVSIMGGAAALSTRTDLKLSSNWKSHTEAFYAAEAGLAKAVATISKFSSPPTTTDLAGITAPVLTNPDISFTAFSVQQVGSGSTVINNIAPYNGLNATETIYLITSEASLSGGSRSRVTLKLQYLQIPLFQFGVLYGEGVDLEIAPGPDMTFNGRVHANSNIYMTNDSLKFDSKVTTAGEVNRYLKRDDPPVYGTNPQIKDSGGVYRDLNFDHYNDYNFMNSWTEADWKSAVDTTFGGMLQDKAHGVEKLIPPIPDLFYNPTNPEVVSHQMIEMGDAADTPEMKDAKLYYDAGLRIENGSVTDQSGSSVDMSSCDPDTIKNVTFYDKREEKTMIATEVDIGLLDACGKAPANGILYVHKSDGASEKGAVRLVNGAELPSQGLTVVAEKPVYVQGDYNTINKVPAAVMGDAITVLSNNWEPNGSDAMGNQVYDNREASDTEVNAAFGLGPNAESVAGQGNGQLENVIRFLEDWDGETFTYRGSIISLWHSQQATGNWNCCDAATGYYSPPDRDWGYDPLFDTLQPPGVPQGIVVIRLAWAEVV